MDYLARNNVSWGQIYVECYVSFNFLNYEVELERAGTEKLITFNQN